MTQVEAGQRLEPKPAPLPIVFDPAATSDSTFETFMEDRSNQRARAAAVRVAKDPGQAHNPLLIHSELGLDKTHLLYAIASDIKQRNGAARVTHVHSEWFISQAVTALHQDCVRDFEAAYRALDVLMIDDVQFLELKEYSQAALARVAGALLASGRQIIVTYRQHPQDLGALIAPLRALFAGGLTVSITRPAPAISAAILMNKAARDRIELPDAVAGFVAENFRTNIRESEGVLRRIVVTAQYTKQPITLRLAKKVAKKLIARVEQ